MAHAHKPYFVFRRKGRVHLYRRGRQFSGLLAAELCASAVVMLDTPCFEVVWRVLATHSIRQFPLHFPSRASPCAITFQLESTEGIYFSSWVKRILYCACFHETDSCSAGCVGSCCVKFDRNWRNKIKIRGENCVCCVEQSVVARDWITGQHFNLQLTHITLKDAELFKHFKISKTVPTCFGLQGNHHQGATVST